MSMEVVDTSWCGVMMSRAKKGGIEASFICTSTKTSS